MTANNSQSTSPSSFTFESLNLGLRATFRAMVENQIELNVKSYAETWFEDGKAYRKDYEVAASQEIGEFINSYGYSWWSKSPRDVSNCKTEIVDAVHFMLSQAVIDCGGNVDTVVSVLENAYSDCETEFPPVADNPGLYWAKLLQVSLLGKQALREDLKDSRVAEGSSSLQEELEACNSFGWSYLFLVAKSIDFSVGALFLRYMGKSELNKFRQLNGYKQGTYRKLWDGVNEDNYFLAKWIDEATSKPELHDIQPWLEQQYAAHTKALGQ